MSKNYLEDLFIEEVKGALNNGVTEEFVKEKILEAQLGGGEVDLSEYAKQEEVTQLKSDFTKLESDLVLKEPIGDEIIEFTSGENIKLAYNIGEVVSLIPETVSNYKYAIVDCVEGDRFIVTLLGGSNPRAWGFLNADNELLSVADVGITLENFELVAPKDSAKLVLNNRRDPSVVRRGDNRKCGHVLTNVLQEVIEIKQAITNTPLEFVYGSNIKLAYNIGEVVNLTPETSAQYRHAIVECSEGDIFTINGTGGYSPRLWGFLNTNNELLSVSKAGAVENDLMIVAPANSSKFVMNNDTMQVSKPSYIKRVLDGEKQSLGLIVENQKAIDNINNRKTIMATPDETISAFVGGIGFANNLKKPLMDFKKSGDLMVHVSTFKIINDVVYCTYYANTRSSAENSKEQTARFAYASLNNPSDMTWIDLQDVGDEFNGSVVTDIYDTIMMTKDDNVLYLMWTASINNAYYRLYRTYTISTGVLSDVYANNFYVGDHGGVWNTTTMVDAFLLSNIEHKVIRGDIGVMQKLSSRVENGVTYYYTGAYATNFNCIIKSSDLINWHYVAMPDFENRSMWENAVYVVDDKVFYFVRQEVTETTGFLTYYDLNTGTWANPVYVHDCGSRSDFLYRSGTLYLVHAPGDRNHISLMWINRDHLVRSKELMTAVVPDYFYPYTLEYNNELYMSFTASRQHIYLSKFTFGLMGDAAINKFKELLGIS